MELNAIDDYGGTVLHEAAFGSNVNAIKYLLDQGSELNATADYGWTPLHSAVDSVRHRLDAVKFLVTIGANIHAKTSDGLTPLALALNNRQDRHGQLIVNYLC